jgi:hypothetical protein
MFHEVTAGIERRLLLFTSESLGRRSNERCANMKVVKNEVIPKLRHI